MDKRTVLTTPVEFDRRDFFSLLSLSVGAAVARQNAFGTFIGGKGWNVVTNEKTHLNRFHADFTKATSKLHTELLKYVCNE